MVYDCEREVVELQDETCTGLSCFTPPIFPRAKLTKSSTYLPSGPHGQKFDLPPQWMQVGVYVDRETESRATLQPKRPDGRSNVLLATIYLDRLGVQFRVLRLLGLVSTLYVAHVAPWAEAESQLPCRRGE